MSVVNGSCSDREHKTGINLSVFILLLAMVLLIVPVIICNWDERGILPVKIQSTTNKPSM